MRQSSPEQDKLYKKFKGGDLSALADLLESERPALFDYLLRMTGQVSRSLETVDEVYQSLTEETLDTIDGYAELKVCVFTTARRFNADIWNAETSRLVNAALEIPEGAEMSEKVLKERHLQAMVDKALRILPGPEREAAYLFARAGFETPEIAEIMGAGQGEAERWRTAAMTKLGRDAGPATGPAEVALAKLPSHPMPPRSSQATVNLSMVMQGIKTRPVGLWSPFRIVLALLLIAAAVLWFAFPGVVIKLLESVSGGNSGNGGHGTRGAPAPKHVESGEGEGG